MSSSLSTGVVRRLATALAASALVAGLTACGTSNDDASTVVRTTTKIAGAGVVGIERDTGAACAPPTPADPGAPDPRRIVVLDSAALDAVCGLGLWERVVGAATSTGETPQPSYLGAGIAALPGVGPSSAPDVDRIAQAAPDLILASEPASPDLIERLQSIAPTVVVGSDPVTWKERFVATGQALGRATAAQQALDAFATDAALVGIEIDARRTQASVIRFHSDRAVIEGPGSFSGQILAATGVQRPAYQRIETASADIDDLAEAEGDLVYVSFAGANGLDYGTSVMESDAWLDLGAATDKRIFAVDDEVWNAGNGVVAARAVLADLRQSLNAYVN